MTRPYRVRHFGNTANNAFYNARILRAESAIESDLPITMFGLTHAISAPAWEVVDFEVPDAAWVTAPDWSMIDGAERVNSEYSDLPVDAGIAAGAGSATGARPAAISLARKTARRLDGKPWATPAFQLAYRWMLSRRPTLPRLSDRIDVIYGADSLLRAEPADLTRTVCVEHGTVRWIADGPREARMLRRAYRDQVARAAHLWVTNLDPRTLEVAEDVAPGRWSALPHPFQPDSRIPFATSAERRSDLTRRTGSSSLVLLPASQNWKAGHDKGSMKALTAFVELRRRGVDVGLIAVEWGLQVAESKAFLDRAGVGGHVAWVAPMARFALQRMMADADVVWDQFGLDAFGALALHAVEQGTPLVSRGLLPIGERLIGGPVPWRHAATSDDIVRETTAVLEDMARRGRETVIAETSAAYRSWLETKHSPAMTARLQSDLYDAIHDGGVARGTAVPERWALNLDAGLREDD